MKTIQTSTPYPKSRPDSKGRVTLGKLAAGYSSFEIIPQEGGLFLRGYSEVPTARFEDSWLSQNPVAFAAINTGLAESVRGEVKALELDFSPFMTEEEKFCLKYNLPLPPMHLENE